ncbi:hypothetical protein VNO77_22585 [Canavalia gladiata]|uniref:Uncharacterized protein n=1 Tax=Canavalia gladiata TaxID=3824 RepID=A0AAN9L835_CANGL
MIDASGRATLTCGSSLVRRSASGGLSAPTPGEAGEPMRAEDSTVRTRTHREPFEDVEAKEISFHELVTQAPFRLEQPVKQPIAADRHEPRVRVNVRAKPEHMIPKRRGRKLQGEITQSKKDPRNYKTSCNPMNPVVALADVEGNEEPAWPSKAARHGGSCGAGQSANMRLVVSVANATQTWSKGGENPFLSKAIEGLGRSHALHACVANLLEQ